MSQKKSHVGDFEIEKNNPCAGDFEFEPQKPVSGILNVNQTILFTQIVEGTLTGGF